MNPITIEQARRVLEIVDRGLVRGLGQPQPGKLCVEAAVCLALGEPHGGWPLCVAPVDRAFKIRLNDSRWSSDQARARGLRRLAVMQLGTAGSDRTEWLKIAVDLVARRVVPETLETVARGRPGSSAHALRTVARRCRVEGSAALSDAHAVIVWAAADVVVNFYDSFYVIGTFSGIYPPEIAATVLSWAKVSDDVARQDQMLLLAARCLEEAYERTGSPGLELLRQIEGSSTSVVRCG